jgi:hypothetical protein
MESLQSFPSFPEIRISQPEGEVSLSIGGTTFKWELEALPLIEYLRECRTVSVDALLKTFSRFLTEEQVRSFLLGAIESGLIIVRDSHPGPQVVLNPKEPNVLTAG